MKKPFFISSYYLIFSSIFIFESCQPGGGQKAYNGKPYTDSVYTAGPQNIPGKLQCEFYDFGGEGIAYHDDDSINSGSGRLNPVNGSYLHQFRISEAVDISYTKFADPPIDNTIYNLVQPEREQLYVGWTKPGEWTKYTVNVTRTGSYKLGLMYTSNKGGKISVSLNDKDATGSIEVPTTYAAADTVAWRQWHHWNFIDKIAVINLNKGIHTITIHTVENGDMNYDYISFELVEN